MGNVHCVIVNYNDAETTSALVRLIHDYVSLDQIVVVDNASTDNSADKLKLLEDDRVTVLTAEKNGGYGAGNNLGVRYSVETAGADYVVIANPDVTFSDQCIRKLTAALVKNPDVGVVAAMMEDPAYKNKPNGWRLHGFAGELLSMGPISRRLFAAFLEYPARHFAGKNMVSVDVVHGSMLMVNGAAFLAAGGYDEAMFLYQEEVVLARRMRAAGYRTALVMKSSYQHEHSASISKTYQSQADRQRLRHKSTMYYFEHYLHINPLRKLAAKVWFGGIMAEIYIWKLFKRDAT